MLIAVLAPASFFFVSYQNLYGILESRAKLTASTVNNTILSNPEMWRYEELRLVELLDRLTDGNVLEQRQILGTNGDIIARSSDTLMLPAATFALDIHDAGSVVGRIEVSRSLRPTISKTFLVAVYSLSIAIALFFVFRSIPLQIIKRAYKSMEESEKKYRLLYETMTEGMALHQALFDEKGGIKSLTVIDANPNCLAMFKNNRDRIIGGNSFLLFGDTLRDFLHERQQLERGESISFELNLPASDDFYHVRAFSPDSGMIATLFENITERRKTEQQVQHMAYFDRLTDLPNRTLFLDRLSNAISNANRENTNLAVLFLDLDHFKQINDTLGHDAGDQLLIEVTQRFRANIRNTDTLARFGGDEFVFIITGLNDQLNATYVAQNLIDSLQPSFHIKGNDLHVTTSIGIALFPYDGVNSEILIKNADLAMYYSKESGRNAFKFYSPEMNEKANLYMEIEAGLRNALNHGDFYIEFQPIMDANAQTIVAAEALVRWNHPTRGMVPPDEFIALAEDTGLILPLGEWVLFTVCCKMKAWIDAGLPRIRFTVNASSRQIEQANFAEFVKKVIQATGADASLLEIELAENSLFNNSGNNLEEVFRLKDCGVSIAIDDFGTGYTPLGYITALQVDHIKISRSLVRGMTRDHRDLALVEAIIAMSQKMGVRNVAEGVETAEQLRLIKQQGCGEMQGYFFHRPLPPDEFEELLKKQIRR